MHLKSIAAAAILAAFSSPIMAQEETAPDPFAQAIADNILAMERSNENLLSGEGWERLMAEAQGAQFFLIGEQHATADIALVSQTIHAGLAEREYDYMVMEIGPWSTRNVEQLVRSGDGKLADYIAAPGNSFTFPFLMFAEETALAEQVVALSPHADHALWGVDQEFLAAGPVLARELARLAETPEQEAAAASLAASSSANPMYIGTALEAEMDALEAAFTNGSDAAQQLVAEIRLTHRIYAPFTGRGGTGYDANLARENYMKRNFLEHFTVAERRDGAPPKVWFKFGGFHMERGLSGTNVPSLGNFVLEWGRSRGLSSVNVMIDCIGGQSYNIMGGGPSDCESYALKEGSPILAALEGHDIALIDLAALRPLLFRQKDLDAKTRDLILSYDYYLAIRDVSAATPLADITLPPM